MFKSVGILILSLIFAAGGFVSGQELKEIPAIERKLPPSGGLAFPAETRVELEKRLKDYVDRIWEIDSDPYIADVGALVKAVEYALKHDEFYNEKEFPLAAEVLALADKRFQELDEKETHSWTESKGLVIRGYESKIDESYQAFGLEIPENLDLSKPVPLLVWLHGRGDKTTDLHFIRRCLGKSQALGGFVSDQQDCIILHPFGRQCIGWKHAGEVDVFEAIAKVKEDYPIDGEKVALAGFSMGGAGAWHIGAHYRDQFCAIHAGAGFAETKEYNKLKPEDFPPAYEQTLWQVYDAPNYLQNFLNGPLLAYSGEVDKQKQAADLMESAFSEIDYKMRHVIGAEMGHKYRKEAVAEIWTWLKESWAAGNSKDPKNVKLETRSLRYPKHHWLKLTGLEKHWQPTTAFADWNADEKAFTIQSENVSSFEITGIPGADLDGYSVSVNGEKISGDSSGFPISSLALRKSEGKWGWGESGGTRKIPGLQGPIDDAFMSRFVIVPPDEAPAHPLVARWVDFELDHFRNRWRELMRGDAIEENSGDLDSGDMEDANLILWGDPWSNRMIEEIVENLPIKWTKESFTFRGKTYDCKNHVPAFIFPNPVNPKRYVVINSGLTFREAHDRTNSLQNPKLPDWAVINLDQDPDGEAPGKVVAADFFDEAWE